MNPPTQNKVTSRGSAWATKATICDELKTRHYRTELAHVSHNLLNELMIRSDRIANSFAHDVCEVLFTEKSSFPTRENVVLTISSRRLSIGALRDITEQDVSEDGAL